MDFNETLGCVKITEENKKSKWKLGENTLWTVFFVRNIWIYYFSSTMEEKGEHAV